MLEVALFVLAVDFVVELDDVVALLLPLPRVLHRRRIGLLVVVVPPLELAAVFVLVERLVVAQLLRFVLVAARLLVVAPPLELAAVFVLADRLVLVAAQHLRCAAHAAAIAAVMMMMSMLAMPLVAVAVVWFAGAVFFAFAAALVFAARKTACDLPCRRFWLLPLPCVVLTLVA